MTPRASIVVPAYNEGPGITAVLDRLLASVRTPSEILVVYDHPEDTTAAPLRAYAARDERVRPLLNEFGPGAARAINFGIASARAGVVVVTMADGSDDVRQIDDLVRLVEQGCAVASASRYSKGGAQHGGPKLKKVLSRAAGVSLWILARTGTRDATNAFKAYSRDFVRAVGVESDAGFELGIELVAKARRARLPVAEIPTVWHDRTEGASNFKLARWLPRYLRWYVSAFGPKRTPEQLRARARTGHR